MISTSGITGTGLKKCMPMKRSGRLVAAAIRVIGIDEVLLARMVVSRQMASSLLNSSRLASKFSVMASITRSARPAASREVVGCNRATASSRAVASSLPFATWLSRRFLILSSARPTIESSTSRRLTSNPRMAAVCAIPEPIRPAPAT